MLEHMSVDIYCIKETRFRGKSVRMISGKTSEDMLFWRKNEKGLGVGIFLAKKRVNKVIDISRVNDMMIDIKVLVQGIIISVISVYAQQHGLDGSQKDDFYDSLTNVARKLGEKETVVIVGDFNSQIGSNPKN